MLHLTAFVILIIILILAGISRWNERSLIPGYYEAHAEFLHEADLIKYSIVLLPPTLFNYITMCLLVVGGNGEVIFAEVFDAKLSQQNASFGLGTRKYKVSVCDPTWEETELFPHNFILTFNPHKSQVSLYNDETDEFLCIAYRDGSVD